MLIIKYQISDNLLFKSNKLIKNSPEENANDNQIKIKNEDPKNNPQTIRIKKIKICNII